MTEISYSNAILSNLHYVNVIYTDSDNKPNEIRTEAKTVSNDNILLYFRYLRNFDVHCPQQVVLKFVTDDGLYVADAILQEARKTNHFVHLKVLPPSRMSRQQNRKYYRINLKRTCVLFVTDKEGCSTAFMSKMVDVSAGGVLIHNLESMFNNEIITINPFDYEYFNIVLFLDVDIVLKLQARPVRTENSKISPRYAFEFINMKQSDIDIISRYVTKEQIEQLKMQNKLKQ